MRTSRRRLLSALLLVALGGCQGTPTSDGLRPPDGNDPPAGPASPTPGLGQKTPTPSPLPVFRRPPGGVPPSTFTTPTPSPTPTPVATPTPDPGPTPLPLSSNLVSKKRRQTRPGSFDDMTPAEMRALPRFGPKFTDADFEAMLDLEAKAVRLEGEFIYFVRRADGNTYGVPKPDGDWHVEVREPSTRTRAQTVDENIITEITPYFQRTQPGWDEAALKRLARYHGFDQVNPKGALVRVYGWLMYDYAHAEEAGIFRGSAWEIHPVTKIEYYDEASASWRLLE